ncbi:saccharopine dehydrogenase NADP-binding domain-containing protein [Paenibacillus senegalensis]|uniref:saccharopine dehydrogenase NADP-binding domain-containing protein n=1 Tax=Paenibacillus senegalensis TaxID=1465766 RepID=UPI000289A2FE|nr:saccharopine dehydrogenase NADP-binding domain-containing protein [Paenibacillus senegalensis]
MRNKILVIGGHGYVGQIIVKNLLKAGIDHLVIGGRNTQKMQEFVQQTRKSIAYRVMDLEAGIDSGQLDDVQMIVMCVDQKNIKLVKLCIEHKIDYVDISARSETVEAIHQLAADKEVSIITNVGLAPGVTNLMVREYLQLAGREKTKVAIDIILGIGDAHGKAAVEWTFSHINDRYALLGEEQEVESFTEGRSVNFFLPVGKKRTYRLNFADQHTLRREYPGVAVSTYLGFDLSLVTRILHGLKKMHLLKVLQSARFISFMQKIMGHKRFGSDVFAVKVSNGGEQDSRSLVVYGYQEARVTGEVAAFVVQKLLKSPEKFGIATISAVCSLSEVLNKLDSLKLGGNRLEDQAKDQGLT